MIERIYLSSTMKLSIVKMMKKRNSTALVVAITALICQPALGQVGGDTAYKQSFQQNVRTGCLNGSSLPQAKKEAYCSCYARLFANRYSASELLAMSNWVANNPNQVGVIRLMMSPEASRCELR